MGNGLRKEPAWREAIDTIAQMVEERGRNLYFSHEEMDVMLDLPKLTKMPKSIDEFEEYFKKRGIERLESMEQLKSSLLEEYNIQLKNVPGQGYRVTEADEQVIKGPDKHMRKAKREMLKANKLLVFVDNNSLSMEAREAQLRQLGRIAFLKRQFAKKNIPPLPAGNNEPKRLTQE